VAATDEAVDGEAVAGGEGLSDAAGVALPPRGAVPHPANTRTATSTARGLIAAGYVLAPYPGSRFDTAPNRSFARHWRMPTLEVISLILVVLVWIALLRGFSADP
jgi:hypothetical protein